MPVLSVIRNNLTKIYKNFLESVSIVKEKSYSIFTISLYSTNEPEVWYATYHFLSILGTLSELTPYQISLGLTHLGSEVSITYSKTISFLTQMNGSIYVEYEGTQNAEFFCLSFEIYSITN